ncbi:MAG: hypothetical protein ACFCVE_09865 [Phycisphaerae bacterium]
MTLLVGGAAWSSGCQQDPEPQAMTPQSSEQQLSQRELVSLGNLNTAPDVVRQRFLEDHGRVSVTGVDQSTTAAGRLIYQVTYVEIPSGDLGKAYYDATGNRLDYISPDEAPADANAGARTAGGETPATPPATGPSR